MSNAKDGETEKKKQIEERCDGGRKKERKT